MRGVHKNTISRKMQISTAQHSINKFGKQSNLFTHTYECFDYPHSPIQANFGYDMTCNLINPELTELWIYWRVGQNCAGSTSRLPYAIIQIP